MPLLQPFSGKLDRILWFLAPLQFDTLDGSLCRVS
jgi:hypothetical protein